MDLMSIRRGLMMMGSPLPSNVYIGSFTPDTNLNSITIDTGLTFRANGSFVIGIITHDLQYGVSGQSSNVAIVDYMGQGSSEYANTHRYMCVKEAGANDYYTNGQISFADGVLTISSLYGNFVAGCKYDVIVMV